MAACRTSSEIRPSALLLECAQTIQTYLAHMYVNLPILKKNPVKEEFDMSDRVNEDGSTS